MTTLWARWWPLAGIAFVGLFIGAFAVTDGSPDSQDDDAQIMSYIASKSNQRHDIAGFLMVLGACLLFIWFLAMLRERVARADGTGTWAALAFGSGVAAAVLWIASVALFSSASFTASDTDKFQLDPNTYRVLNDAGYAVWFSGTTLALGVVAGTTVAAFRTGFLPRWLAWLSIPVALSMLVSFFFFPFLIFCGWVLVVAATLMMRREAPGPAAVPG